MPYAVPELILFSLRSLHTGCKGEVYKVHRPGPDATHGDAITDRLRIAMSAESDGALARALGVSPATVSSWRNRDSRPYALCIDIAERRAISLDWLLIGTGPMRRDREADVPQPSDAPDSPPLPDRVSEGAPPLGLAYRLAALADLLARLPPADAEAIIAAAHASATAAARITELERQLAARPARPAKKKEP